MKKLILAIVFIVCFTLANSAFACEGDGCEYLEYDKITTMAKTDTGWVETNVFGWDQKPWLFLDLPDQLEDFKYTITNSKWNDPGPGSGYDLNDHSFNTESHRVGDQLYLSFVDWKWFGKNGSSGLRELGEWNIDVYSKFGPGCIKVTGNTNFTITPEPISSALFLLGSGALAIVKRVRRKA